MIQWFRNQLEAARLSSEIRLEALRAARTASEADASWQPLDPQRSPTAQRQLRERARELARCDPHARQILRLLETYVTGPGLTITHHTAGETQERPATPEQKALAQRADLFWQQFLATERTHWSYTEHARRTWRDGEAFVRLYPQDYFPPAVRFVEPEHIADERSPETQGIHTDPADQETPVSYIHRGEAIPAQEIIHSKINADSNELRGRTIFEPIIDTLGKYSDWLTTEIKARRLQASIVLWRKITGQDAAQFRRAADGASAEPLRPGTILTTTPNTEMKFLQPDTNFADSLPLGSLLLRAIAAGQGMPEFMVTSDASNANYASTMVAEGPAVKLFQAEQRFFAEEFERLRRFVLGEAVRLGLLPPNFFNAIVPTWTFPDLVSRNRGYERQADVMLVQNKVLSAAEVARRDGVDPGIMRAEIAAENIPTNPLGPEEDPEKSLTRQKQVLNPPPQ